MKLLNDFLATEYSYTTADLGIYRVLYCLVVLLTLPFATWLVHLPPFMFSAPLSPAALLTEFPPATVYFTLNIVTAMSALLLLFGIYPTSASLILSISMLSTRAFAYSSGKINHDILICVIPAVLAFSRWGEWPCNLCQRDKNHENRVDADGFPVAILAFLTAFWMATGGWAKLITDWGNPAYSAIYDYLFEIIHVLGRSTISAELAITFFPVWLWEVLDWATVLFELAGILLVWKRQLFRKWLFVACFFHFGIDLIMSIPFYSAPLAYGVFLPWNRLTMINRLLSSPRHCTYLLWAIIVIVFMGSTLPSIFIQCMVVWTAPIVALMFATRRFFEPYNR